MKTKFYLFFLLFFPVLFCHGVILDRIVAIFNDKIITDSEIKQARSNIKARSNIAREIYDNKKYTFKELVNKELQTRIIRSHLREIGYIVNDDQVNKMINQIKRDFNISKKQLVSELSSENISFQEYFELLRISREYNLIIDVVIKPLVTIKEQQVKNQFFKDNIKNNALSIYYSLISYSLSSEGISKKDAKDFVQHLSKYRTQNIIPQKYSSLEKINIGTIQEDSLSSQMKSILKKTNEGDFSEPFLSNGSYTSFYVKEKNLSESSFFKREREKIYLNLLKKEIKKVFAFWLVREKEKHHIKLF